MFLDLLVLYVLVRAVFKVVYKVVEAPYSVAQARCDLFLEMDAGLLLRLVELEHVNEVVDVLISRELRDTRRHLFNIKGELKGGSKGGSRRGGEKGLDGMMKSEYVTKQFMHDISTLHYATLSTTPPYECYCLDAHTLQ